MRPFSRTDRSEHHLGVGLLPVPAAIPVALEPKNSEAVRQEANVLGVPPDKFLAAWNKTYHDRTVGRFPSHEQLLTKLCFSLGRQVGEDALREAARLRAAYLRRALRPRPDAVPTLHHLRADGYEIGLLTNSALPIPALFREGPLAPLFDPIVFSCEVGLRKPDPAIFLLTCDCLRMRPHDCLFVADGDDGELATASSLGMKAICIRAPQEAALRVARYRTEEWDGETITALSNLQPLLSR